MQFNVTWLFVNNGNTKRRDSEHTFIENPQNPKPHLKLRRIYEFLILTENKTTMPRNCTNLVVALVPYKAF